MGKRGAAFYDACQTEEDEGGSMQLFLVRPLMRFILAIILPFPFMSERAESVNHTPTIIRKERGICRRSAPLFLLHSRLGTWKASKY